MGNRLSKIYTRTGDDGTTGLGDGTLTDLATGLMWQQADSGVGLDWEEALELLQDEGPEDLRELTYALGAEMLRAADVTTSVARAERMLTQVLRDGSAARKMEEIVRAQGGDVRVVGEPDRLQLARRRTTVTSGAAAG